jgi:hypothetical protein
MNYFYQTSGVWRNGDDGHFDYSRFLLPSLSETALYEAKGLGPLTIPDAYATKYLCPNGSLAYVYATGWLDWNCNVTMQTSTVKVDLNGDYSFTSLGSQNNWTSFTFKGNGVVGKASAAMAGELSAQGPLSTIWVEELEEGQLPPAPPTAPMAK